MIAKVRITSDLNRVMSCEAIKEAPPEIREEIAERFTQWLGDEVQVYLPALPKPTGRGKPCSSKWFWRVANESETVDNAEGCACFCEHMLDMD